MTDPDHLPFNGLAGAVDEPAQQPPGPRYATVWEWVEDWFVLRIRRRMNPAVGKGLSWDPAWWRYPEVVARLLALHAAWEEASAADAAASASAMSTWWLSHLEPHLRVIFDSDSGPMSLAAPDDPLHDRFAGHPPLSTVPVPDEVKQDYDQHPNRALEALEPMFPTVWDWVEGWFVKVIRRRIQTGKGLSWDPAWWRYPEVVARFQALHAAWEFACASESPSAWSVWWVSHLDSHLRVIFDGETGPMSLAGSDSTFTGHTPLGSVALPDAVKQQLAPKG
ncbi:DUF4913 domain-containing protein [Nocardia sp. XZ_19_369]|uniref:DUF4913 domain-containing protein n=1 Tax=Nocardia sp. XZ_19_369 TaxID=2769487 RepID=UPI0027D274FF|nr:DUF4913 domain-containing protein [Nocardia sp. XZ_19_369]